MMGKECVVILCKWYDLMVVNVDDFVVILIVEMGKLLVEVKGEIMYGVLFIEWFVEEVKCVYGDIIFGY